MEDDKNQLINDNGEEIESTSNKLDGEDSVEQTDNSLLPESGESLEGAEPTDIEADEKEVIEKPKQSFYKRILGLINRVNVYLLLFILIILISAIAVFASYRANKTASNTKINGQILSDKDLQNLKNNDTSVGDPKQTLTIASNAIFNGRVLVKDNLDVAGTLRVGTSISLPGINVSGTSAFENVQVGNTLSIAGSTTIQGNLSVQRNLTIGGSASFAGAISAPTLSVDKLILNQNLQLNRHVEAGGPTPGISRGPAIGGYGSVSINGSDTAGTINFNFGSTAPGVMATINFVNAYNQTPHVVITPVGASCSAIDYFVTRTTTYFSIGSTNSGPNGQSCSFDYIVID